LLVYGGGLFTLLLAGWLLAYQLLLLSIYYTMAKTTITKEGTGISNFIVTGLDIYARFIIELAEDDYDYKYADAVGFSYEYDNQDWHRKGYKLFELDSTKIQKLIDAPDYGIAYNDCKALRQEQAPVYSRKWNDAKKCYYFTEII
jgi:hypothetical protein